MLSPNHNKKNIEKIVMIKNVYKINCNIIFNKTLSIFLISTHSSIPFMGHVPKFSQRGTIQGINIYTISPTRHKDPT